MSGVFSRIVSALRVVEDWCEKHSVLFCFLLFALIGAILCIPSLVHISHREKALLYSAAFSPCDPTVFAGLSLLSRKAFCQMGQQKKLQWPHHPNSSKYNMTEALKLDCYSETEPRNIMCIPTLEFQVMTPIGAGVFMFQSYVCDKIYSNFGMEAIPEIWLGNCTDVDDLIHKWDTSNISVLMRPPSTPPLVSQQQQQEL